MAHHKRRKPKNKRAGCLWCKPHKHQRAKDCFDSKTVQEKRELQDELPSPAYRSRKKNTVKWCRGREGVPHEPAWVDKGRWWHHINREPRWSPDWRLCCTKCGKELGWVSKWLSDDPVHVRKFPGWERFLRGPAS